MCKLPSNDLNELLNKVENLETERSYEYSEQKGIGDKSTLVYNGEGLKKYTLPIKLHVDFCNPKEIIDNLVEFAEQAEPFPYFQGENYIGDFVISGIKDNVIDKYGDKIIYAEVYVEITEAGISEIDEYEQQTIKKVNTESFNPTETKSLTDKLTDKINIVESYADKATSVVEDKVNLVKGAITSSMNTVTGIAKKAVSVVPVQKITSVYNKLTPETLNSELRRSASEIL